MKLREIFFHFFLIFLFGLVAGTFWHEIVGHGLTASFYGGEIRRLVILGVQILPSVEVVGFDSSKGFFGWIEFEGVGGEEKKIVLLMGSVSTFMVSIVGLLAFLFREFRGYLKTIVFSFSIWFIDLFYHTLRFGEVLQAAKSLGASEWLFFIIVAGISLAFAALIIKRLREVK